MGANEQQIQEKYTKVKCATSKTRTSGWRPTVTSNPKKIMNKDENNIKSVNKNLILFVILTFAISWPIWYSSGVLSRGDFFIYDSKWLIAQIGVFAPSLSALIISSFHSKKLRWNGLRFLSIFVLIFIAGKIITLTSPKSIYDFSQTISIIVIIIGLTSLLFFSSLNKRLLIPGSGKSQVKSRAKMIMLAVLGFPLLFLLVWFIVNIHGHSWSVSSLKNGHSFFLAFLLTVFFMNMILGGSIGEESGWRGFALPLLLKKYSPVEASIILGLITAVWHIPIDISNDFLQAIGAIVIRIVWSFSLSIIFTWFFLKTGGSLLIAIIFHTAINILPDIGFSRYEQAILILTVPLIIVSFSISHRLSTKNQLIIKGTSKN
ncbi:MAG: CPBP family intramembrane metalloprotease [Alphaproteobacteria bacterium]|nr:CPBP family intramembrane metalloprotease [Alphaproteobacteria bacterium]